MRKKKILIMSDSYTVFTGFAAVARHVSDYLHKTGKYEVAYLCWFHAPVNNLQPPFTYYTTLKNHKQCCGRPDCIMKHEPEKEPEYFRVDKGVLIPIPKGNACYQGGTIEADKYAYTSFHAVALDFKPDIVWSVSDCWMQYHVNMMKFRKSYVYISYFPVDGSPLPYITQQGPQVINWVDTIYNSDVPVAYCEFGRDTMIDTGKRYGKDLSKVRYIYHGVDFDNIKQVTAEEKKEYRKKWFNIEDDNTFLIGCFLKDTPILMGDYTYNKIQDIKSGDKVINHLGEEDLVVTPDPKDYTGDIYTFKANGLVDDITATQEHPFLCMKNRKGYKTEEINNIKFDSKTTAMEKMRKTGADWEPIKNIKKHDYICEPILKKVIDVEKISTVEFQEFNDNLKRNRLPEYIKIDNDFMRFLGLFVAEGSFGYQYDINGARQHPSSINFSFNSHEENNIKFIEKYAINNLGYKDINIRKNFRNNENIAHVTIELNGMVLCKFMISILNGTKCQSKHLKKWFLYLPKEKQEAFLEGWTDGDGCETKDGRNIRVTTCKEMAIQSGFMFARIGKAYSINTDYYEYNRNKNHSIRYRITTWSNPAKQINILIDDNYIYRRIREMSSQHYKGKVYNFEVKNKNSYCLVQCAVHNSVSRNQPRKAQHKFLEALADIKKRNVTKDKKMMAYLHCLTDDNYIRTANEGMKNVSEISKNDIVLSKGNTWNKVDATKSRHYTGNLQYITSSCSNIPIICTDYHRFPVMKAKDCSLNWKNSKCHKNCKEQNRSKGCKKYYKKYKESIEYASHIQRGDLLQYPINKQLDEHYQLEISPKYGNIVINNEFMRFAGYYLSDGSATKKGLIRLDFNKTEVNNIENSISIIKKVFGIIPRKRYERNCIRISFSSKEIALFLRKFFNGKSPTKKIPQILINKDRSLLLELLNGLWRGDGSYTDRFNYCTISMNLAYDVWNVLLRCNIISVISRRIFKDKLDGIPHKAKYTYYINISRQSQEEFAEEALYDYFDPSDLINTKHILDYDSYIEDNVLYQKVRNNKRKYVTDKKIYNLRVKSDHTYAVSHLISMNCPLRDVGWDIPALIKQHNLEDTVILNDKLRVGVGPTDKEMNEIYNSFDLHTVPSRGEGFGMTYSESMLAGVPTLMSEYSAHDDWARHGAARIDIKALDAEPITNINRAIVDTKDYADKILWFYNEVKVSEAYPDKRIPSYLKSRWYNPTNKEFDMTVNEFFSTKGIEICNKYFNWVDITKKWEHLIDGVDISSNEPYPTFNIPKPINLGDLLDREKKDRILYVMPGTYGDVFLSTAVVDSLKKKYSDKDIYFAVAPQFASILEGNPNIHKVLHYTPTLENVPQMNQMFDMVFSPSIDTRSNTWTKNGYGRHLADTYASHCGVEVGDLYIRALETELPDEDYIVIHTTTGQKPKNWDYYQDLTKRIDCKMVQVGSSSDTPLKGVKDLRGLDIHQTAYVIKNAKLFIGGDSICSHIAGYAKTDMIILYSSTFEKLTHPLGKEQVKYIALEPKDRFGCDRPCHLAQCYRGQYSCINNISIGDVVSKLEYFDIRTKEAPPPTISGYTTCYNPEKHYPWRECIKSMLGFCDEVVVVDGGSKDGTYEELKEWKKNERKLKVYKRRWKDNEPSMDGMQKAYARALCRMEYCWQQDLDEIVHENDYTKITKLTKEFPANTDILILPVLDLYGTAKTVRCDKGLYKWRLSVNKPEITHGIPKQLRQKDENGKVFCDKSLCDGCFMVHTNTGDMIQAQSTFFTPEMAKLMMENPDEYIKQIIPIFKELPSIWHFSWHNLKRRMKVDLEFWDEQWKRLNNDKELPKNNRFFPGMPRSEITKEKMTERANYLKDKKLDEKPMPFINIDWLDIPEVIKPYLEKEKEKY